MIAKVTDKIKVSVDTKYQSEHSQPDKGYFLFSYHIRIENQGDYAVKLLSRRWEIFDTLSKQRVVEGQGVVGQQPQIEPGKFYQYESACNLTSEMGSMKGTYYMQRLADGSLFEVEIPEFKLVVPAKMN